MVNGISITDPYSGEVGTNVENNAVQELTVVSGTFNAEYGQAQSGIINIVTKEGGQQYTGSISSYIGSYYTDADEYIILNSIRPSSLLDIRLQFNGPIPVLSLSQLFLKRQIL